MEKTCKKCGNLLDRDGNCVVCPYLESSKEMIFIGDARLKGIWKTGFLLSGVIGLLMTGIAIMGIFNKNWFIVGVAGFVALLNLAAARKAWINSKGGKNVSK